MPVTISEQAILDAYRETLKGSVASTDSGTGTVLTAAFSIATAYGALIGLVAPTDQPSSVAVGIPFAVFGAAAVLAMIALVQGIKVAAHPTSDELISPFKSLLLRKRLLAGAAVAALAAAIIVSAVVVINAYGPGAQGPTEHAKVIAVVPDNGTDAISAACPGATGSVTGEIHLDSLEKEFVVVDVPAGTCQGSGTTTLRIPKASVQAIVAQ